MDLLLGNGRRSIEFKSSAEVGPFCVISMKGSEGVSELYQFELELVTRRGTTVRNESLLGLPATVLINGFGSPRRHIHGIVQSISLVDRNENYTRYVVRLVPEVWSMTLNRRSRIFQRESVPQILKRVLVGKKVTYRLSDDQYPEHNYCVQYGESDFDFASRLMEEEGIHYFFEHTQEGVQMVLADAATSVRELPEQATLRYDDSEGGVRSESRIYSWIRTQQLGADRVGLLDHHMEKPGNALAVEEPIVETMQVGRVTQKLRGAQSLATRKEWQAGIAHRFDGTGSGGESQKGEIERIFPDRVRVARIRSQELALQTFRLDARSTCSQVIPGYRFVLDGYFDASEDLNDDDVKKTPVFEFLITHVDHDAKLPFEGKGYVRQEEFYDNQFQSVPANMPYRPARKTPRPVVRGPETAIVVGDDSITTEEYGRVKVRFLWDEREGAVSPRDRSAWLRVSQSSAGGGFGHFSLPRIDQEVIVDFLGGDPDCPIIVGSLYNASNRVPFSLPENRTQSGIKSKSKNGRSSKNFSGIAIEDKDGSEHLQIQAERNMTVNAESMHALNVGGTSWTNVAGTSIRTVGGLLGVDIGTQTGSGSSGSGGGSSSAPPVLVVATKRGKGSGSGGGSNMSDDELNEKIDGRIKKKAADDKAKAESPEQKKEDHDKAVQKEEDAFKWTMATRVGGIAQDIDFSMALKSSSDITYSNGLSMGSGTKFAFEPVSLCSELGIDGPFKNYPKLATGLAATSMLVSSFSASCGGSTKIGFSPSFSCDWGTGIKVKAKGKETAFSSVLLTLEVGTQLLPLIPKGIYRQIFFPAGLGALKIATTIFSVLMFAKKIKETMKESADKAKGALEFLTDKDLGSAAKLMTKAATAEAADQVTLTTGAVTNVGSLQKEMKLGEHNRVEGCRVMSASTVSIDSKPGDDDQSPSLILLHARPRSNSIDQSGTIFMKAASLIGAKTGNTMFAMMGKPTEGHIYMRSTAPLGEIELTRGISKQALMLTQAGSYLQHASDKTFQVSDTELLVKFSAAHSLKMDPTSGTTLSSTKITLKSGASKIEMSAQGIKISGPSIEIDGLSSTAIKTAVAKVGV